MWLRMSAAAARVGVSRSTLKRWVDEGTVPANAVRMCGRQARIAIWYCDGYQAPPAGYRPTNHQPADTKPQAPELTNKEGI